MNGVASGVGAYMVTRSNLTPPLASSPNWVGGPTAPTSFAFLTTVNPGAILYAWVKDVLNLIVEFVCVVVYGIDFATGTVPCASESVLDFEPRLFLF